MIPNRLEGGGEDGAADFSKAEREQEDSVHQCLSKGVSKQVPVL